MKTLAILGMILEAIEFAFWLPEVIGAINGENMMNIYTWAAFGTGVFSFYLCYNYVKTGIVPLWAQIYSYLCLVGYLFCFVIVAMNLSW